jgi:ligand-binding sensor domain-containing protein/signal transduction histidine kinase
MVVGYLSRICLCLATLTTLATCALAQRLPLKAYSVADGLPNNVINKIVRDSRGLLWFCTAEGLSRFDGYSFTNYGIDQGLPHQVVNDFLETRSGELWIATNGGLVLFSPKGEPSSHVTFTTDKSSVTPMFTVLVPDDSDRAARAVNVLLEDASGTIWCGTMKRLYRLERQDAAYALQPVDLQAKEVYALDLIQDRSGRLWIGAATGLFCRELDGRIRHYTRRDGLPDEVIHDLAEDHLGRLWVATRNRGFFRFSEATSAGKSVVAEVYTRQQGLPTDWVFQLFEASDHRFWLATNAGLIEFLGDGAAGESRFRPYTQRNGLTFREITALSEDSSGNLWLGTNVTGAMKLARYGFTTYDEADGITTVNAIFGDHAGGVCFRAWVNDATSSAAPGHFVARQQLGRYDDHGFQWFMPSSLKKDGWVFEHVTLQTRNGEWWIGTGSGLYRFPATENFAGIKSARPLAVYTTADGLATQQVFRLFEDSTGDIWIATIGPPNGLARWRRATNKFEDLGNAESLPSPKDDLVRSFGEDSAGNIWIGFSAGLARFRSGRFTFFTTRDGLPAGSLGQIFRDHAGRLWISSSRSGLIRIDDPAADPPIFKNYTTSQDLSANGTGSLTEDLQGRIYVGTGRGLDQLNPDTGHVKHFTTADGLASGGITGAFCDRTGALWFATQKGMSRFQPSPSGISSSPPLITISSLRIMGRLQRVSALGENEVTLPDLSANQNQMQIDFVALSFAVGDVLRYQYKLEGSGGDWSALTEQRTVNLASLSPGHYRFVVRAANSDGVVSAQPAVVSFTILPPIWQRWWFLMLAASIVMLGVFALYRYRVARLLELERVRTRIASDLHDDIGSNLSLIAGLSEVLGQQARQLDVRVAERLSLIASVSRRSVDAMSDIVWAVNPKRDNALDLSQRMRRFASDTLAARNIEFHLDAPNVDRNTRVNAEIRREVFLIFKEAINNVARHAACQTAEAHLRIERGAIILTLHDDGRGFKGSNGDLGHGLESMRRRAHRLGGELKIDSTDGKGTTLELRIPLNYRSE